MTKFLLRMCLVSSVFFTLPSFAQSRLSIKAADSLAFLLTINESAFNSMPCIAVTLDLPENPALPVKIAIPSHPEIKISQNIPLKKNTAHFFEIEKKKGNWKLVLKSESTIELLNTNPAAANIPVPAEQTGNINPGVDSTIGTDSTGTDEGGKCAAPISTEEFEKMILETEQNVFESRKLDYMKNYLSEHCIRVEQLRYMLSKLSMEENKVILAKASIEHIYDLSNFYRIEEDFFLEKNKARIHELVITAGK